MLAHSCSADDGWGIRREPDEEPTWLLAEPNDVEVPLQGWKLHISADAIGAEITLACVLPVLVEHRVPFKVTATQDMLTWFNIGAAGKSQIGKFVTVYPTDDSHAVRIAKALLATTGARRGPQIPSDRRLGKHSVVHYRYGTMKSRWQRTPLGEFVEVLAAPDGTLVPDLRTTRFRAPAWADDPFVAAGLPIDEDGLVLAGRFLRTATLYMSNASLVVLATDLDQGGSCVVKRSGRYFGQDLLAEAETLRRLPAESTRPEIREVVEHDGDVLLVLEDIPGKGIDVVVPSALIAADPVPVIDWGTQLSRALGVVHGAGMVFGDLTPRNVIVTPDGSLRLVDYGLARQPTHDALDFGGGTTGYASPEQLEADGLVVEDDVHGLGATLHLALTGIPPSPGATEAEVADRMRRLSPGVDNELVRMIGRCVAPTRAERYHSMREVEEALSGVVGDPVQHPSWGQPPLSRTIDEARAHARERAFALADRICDDATFSDDGAWWNGAVASLRDMRYRDLNGGDAGIVVALAELVKLARAPRHVDILQAAADALARGPEEPQPLSGLYVGESGVGIALLRAGTALGDDGLVDAASQRSAIVRAFPHASPDLFNGSAGRLWFHLELHVATGSTDELQAAIEAASFLLGAAEKTHGGGLGWRFPDGFDPLSGKLGLGHAHGAAGIGDAFLDLFDATEDERYLATANRVGSLLASTGVPIADGAGVQWPEYIGEQPVWACWCVGAGGIGRFLRRLASYGGQLGATDLAERAAWSVARTTRWTQPIQCHGLAGNTELLVDAYAATGDAAYLREAYSLAELFDEAVAARIEGKGGHDYLMGSAGLLTALIRLADPETSRHAIRPNLLSPRASS